MKKYQQVSMFKLKKYFEIKQEKSLFRLNSSSNYSNSIFIKIPFILNEDVASIAGLMPDGSLIKDLMRVYFHQKKDISKIYLFQKLIKNLFKPESKIFREEKIDHTRTYINSKMLAIFFYYILQIPKSDEQMRVPPWVFKSPESVKISYLKEAFDMEGTISKRLHEIRFVSRDEKFIYDLQKLLLSLDITTTVTLEDRPFSPQYRLFIFRKENFIKFKKIGFRVPNNRIRFQELVKKYKI